MIKEIQEANLDDVLFPIGIWDVVAQSSDESRSLFEPECPPILATSFRALVDLERHNVLAVVSKGYELVTNAEAIERGKEVFMRVFSQPTADTMSLYNVVTPSTRSFCHIDYTVKGYKFSFTSSDDWFPFLRITNSYNRMRPLRFDLGFCRAICRNGMIFNAESITVKRYHTHAQMRLDALEGIDLAAIKRKEVDFLEKLVNLKRYAVPPNMMLPLTCKVFDIKVETNQLTIRGNKERVRKWGSQIAQLTDQYFAELGHNGYAAFNVLTEYASRPDGVGFSQASRIHTLQARSGAWIDEFIQSIEKRAFDFEEYVKDYQPTADLVTQILSA